MAKKQIDPETLQDQELAEYGWVFTRQDRTGWIGVRRPPASNLRSSLGPLVIPYRATREEVYSEFLNRTASARSARKVTEEALQEYKTIASGRYTYANPAKFLAKYNAACEYERIERWRIGARPIQHEKIAAGPSWSAMVKKGIV